MSPGRGQPSRSDDLTSNLSLYCRTVHPGPGPARRIRLPPGVVAACRRRAGASAAASSTGGGRESGCQCPALQCHRPLVRTWSGVRPRPPRLAPGDFAAATGRPLEAGRLLRGRSHGGWAAVAALRGSDAAPVTGSENHHLSGPASPCHSHAQPRLASERPSRRDSDAQ